MNFQPVRAIWFSGVFYWLVDNLHTRPNRNIIKQIFDIVIAQTNTNAQTIKAGTIVVSTVPILIVYPFVQKYFVKGVMIGGVKG